MGMMIIRHKVRDYGHWRPLFDGHVEMQKAAGLTNPRVYHSADSNKSEIGWSLTLRTQKALRPSLLQTISRTQWRRLVCWTLRQSISLNRSIEEAGPASA